MGLQIPRRSRYCQRMSVPRLGLAMVLCGSLALAAAAQEAPAKKPFFDLRGREPEYAGPQGDRLSPEEVSEVRIGYFGPADPDHPLYGNLWTAAQRRSMMPTALALITASRFAYSPPGPIILGATVSRRSRNSSIAIASGQLSVVSMGPRRIWPSRLSSRRACRSSARSVPTNRST